MAGGQNDTARKARKRLLRLAAAALAAAMLWTPAWAQGFSPFVVDDIRIDGLRRFDPGVVFSRVGIQPGEEMTGDKSVEIIRALFETGFFRSVEVLREGGILVLKVEENPTIAEVNFSGVTELPDDALEGMLKSANIVKARVFDRALAEQAAKALEEIYIERNFYQVEIDTVVSPLPRNRVALLFEVEEGEQASVRSITIEGNEVFSGWRLKRAMNLEPRGLLNYFTDNYLFSQSRLDADLERIRTLYLEEGYLRFSVDEKEAEVSPDKRHIDIRIRVSEGHEYTLAAGGESAEGESAQNAAVFAGAVPSEISEEELREHLTQEPGEVFSSQKAGEAASQIRDVLGDYGYAFAEVAYDSELNDEDGTVQITYNITPGLLAYVRRIEITGNDRTRDEVIRRELLQFERERYSRNKVESSRRRILRLGFFNDVSVTPERVEGSEDELDLLLQVRESGVGSFRVGAGFSTDNDLSFEAGLDTPNIFGSGNNFSADFSISDSDNNIRFSLDEYYHTDEGVSRHIRASVADRSSSGNASSYSIDGTGVEYGYGIPYADDGKYNAFFAYEKIEVASISSVPAYQAFIDKHGRNLKVLSFKPGIDHDTRDSLQQATDGQRINFSADFGLPLLDLKYYKADYEHDFYWQNPGVFGKPVWHLRAGAGFGGGYGGDEYPFYHRYYVGGTSSLRGFESNEIGGETVSGRAVGGRSRAFVSLEAAVDLDLFKSQKVYLAPFIDAGIVGRTPFGNFAPWRASAGLEIRWVSPIGPLRFSWATPLKSETGDDTQNLQFSVRY
ncbi:MAG: outer membrane protein assembly factor BamA [Gammaproteobacteria bacterium]